MSTFLVLVAISFITLIPADCDALTYVDLYTGEPIMEATPSPLPPPPPTDVVVPIQNSPRVHTNPMTGEHYIINPDGSTRPVTGVIPHGPGKVKVIFAPPPRTPAVGPVIRPPVAPQQGIGGRPPRTPQAGPSFTPKPPKGSTSSTGSGTGHPPGCNCAACQGSKKAVYQKSQRGSANASYDRQTSPKSGQRRSGGTVSTGGRQGTGAVSTHATGQRGTRPGSAQTISSRPQRTHADRSVGGRTPQRSGNSAKQRSQGTGRQGAARY